MTPNIVEWLQEISAEEAQRARDYREVALGTPRSRHALNIRELYAEEGTEWMLQEASKYEADAKRYEAWAALVEDMVRCGLEQEAIDFYFARQSVDRGVVAWQGYTIEWTTGGIAEHLEQRLNHSEEQIDELNKIYVTLCATILPALQSEFVEYYEQKRRERPDLKLPEPEYWED